MGTLVFPESPIWNAMSLFLKLQNLACTPGEYSVFGAPRAFDGSLLCPRFLGLLWCLSCPVYSEGQLLGRSVSIFRQSLILLTGLSPDSPK